MAPHGCGGGGCGGCGGGGSSYSGGGGYYRRAGPSCKANCCTGWICVTNVKVLMGFGATVLVLFIVGIILAATAPTSCPSGCTSDGCTSYDDGGGTTDYTCTCDDGTCSDEEASAGSGVAMTATGIVFIIVGIVGGIFSCFFCCNRQTYLSEQAAAAIAATIPTPQPPPLVMPGALPGQPVMYSTVPTGDPSMLQYPPGAVPGQPYPMMQYPPGSVPPQPYPMMQYGNLPPQPYPVQYGGAAPPQPYPMQYGGASAPGTYPVQYMTPVDGTDPSLDKSASAPPVVGGDSSSSSDAYSGVSTAEPVVAEVYRG